MDRRTFLGVTAAMFGAAPRAADAQPARMRRIGFLSNGNSTTAPSQASAFRRGLRELGWIEGENVTFEFRWADGNPERLPTLVAELVRANVDAFVVAGPIAIQTTQKATTTIPIVFVLLVDPVAMGIVQSLARPGGNLTGTASHFDELITKQLQLLKEAVPKLSRVALLHRFDSTPSILATAQVAAQSLGLAVVTLKVADVAEFESAFKLARKERVGAMHVLPSPYLGVQRARVIELAARYRLPACYEHSLYVKDGGLMCYGPNLDAMYYRAASYVDRIFKGANPGELAIERPARFELVINLKAASALGLSIPQTLLQRADELIQ